MKQLLVDLDTLPESGQRFSGQLDTSIFDLNSEEIRPLGPLEFDLYAQRLDNELLFQGSLSCTFEFQCVRTLHAFTHTILLPKAAIAVETGHKTPIDATQALREEVLIEIPNHPTCEIADEPQTCEIDPLYLAVDNSHPNAVDTPPRESGDSRWEALDALSQPSEENS